MRVLALTDSGTLRAFEQPCLLVQGRHSCFDKAHVGAASLPALLQSGLWVLEQGRKGITPDGEVYAKGQRFWALPLQRLNLWTVSPSCLLPQVV